MIETVQWAAIGPAVEIPYLLSRLRSANSVARVRWVTNLMFAFVFTRPFVRRLHASLNEVSFDVTACPLSQYFRDVGFPELTRYAACSLDHRLARQWGVQLHRQHTLAEGHSLCDFRFVDRRSQT